VSQSLPPRKARRVLTALNPRARGPRTVLVLALVALAGIACGLVLSTRIISPSQAAADAAPPTAGPIAIPAEQRVISNQVVVRGDGRFDDPKDLTLNTGELSGSVVVTGSVPATGTQLDAGTVALEVIGRPVIVLPGNIPAYRTLRAGMSGPDVAQLKSALSSMGIDPGIQNSDAYDALTATAVQKLYQRIGYEPPSASSETTDELTSAQAAERSAEQLVQSASLALGQAKSGPPQSQLIELDTAVSVAQQDLADNEAACAQQSDPSSTAGGCSQASIIEAQGTLAAAIARRAEARAAPDTAQQSTALNDARAALKQAQDALSKAQMAVLTALPASEVFYISALPRRVDQVDVKLGGPIDGTVMTVSGATIAIDATVDAASAALLRLGMPGSIVLDGNEIAVIVTNIQDATSSSAAAGPSPAPSTSSASTAGADSPAARQDGAATGGTSERTGDMQVRLEPSGDLQPAQVSALRGANVRVTIPVSSTGGKVLAVPLAALTAGPGGESRVNVQQPDGTFRLIGVETGLAADGYVEIKHADGSLEVGDRVMIGTSTTKATSG